MAENDLCDLWRLLDRDDLRLLSAKVVWCLALFSEERGGVEENDLVAFDLNGLEVGSVRLVLNDDTRERLVVVEAASVSFICLNPAE